MPEKCAAIIDMLIERRHNQGMTQKERQERSKREILQAAMEEFGNYGYEKVTVESICSRHGISVNTTTSSTVSH